MIIGIDVDGTLTDIAGFMLERGEKHFKRAADDPAAFDIQQMFACTAEERRDFWKRNLISYCIRMPIIDGAAETIRRLHDDGHRICIVTSRVYTTEKGPVGALFRAMLRIWLKRRGVACDDIVFCSDSGEAKLEQCRRHGVDIMIDDKPENLITISETISVIGNPMPWNRNIEEKGITRARDWKDIYSIIKGNEAYGCEL